MSDEYTEEEEKLLSWFKDNLKSMLIGLFAVSSLYLHINTILIIKTR